jgi:hypothetical protein
MPTPGSPEYVLVISSHVLGLFGLPFFLLGVLAIKLTASKLTISL